MLNPQELLCAMGHSRATGDKPVGHYDHDVNSLSGPTNVLLNNDDVLSALNNDEDSVNVEYITKVDENTGEVLYYLK